MALPEIRSVCPADREWIAPALTRTWGSTEMISRGRRWNLLDLPAFAAFLGGDPAGVVTCRFEKNECEITSLNSFVENRGIGAALIAAVEDTAREKGCRRLWLVTTNDNLHAIGFYQRRGFRLAALHRGAVDKARKMKPQIPELGMNRIPLRDEIELEKLLSPTPAPPSSPAAHPLW